MKMKYWWTNIRTSSKWLVKMINGTVDAGIRKSAYSPADIFWKWSFSGANLSFSISPIDGKQRNLCRLIKKSRKWLAERDLPNEKPFFDFTEFIQYISLVKLGVRSQSNRVLCWSTITATHNTNKQRVYDSCTDGTYLAQRHLCQLLADLCNNSKQLSWQPPQRYLPLRLKMQYTFIGCYHCYQCWEPSSPASPVHLELTYLHQTVSVRQLTPPAIRPRTASPVNYHRYSLLVNLPAPLWNMSI
jgi:hypothetical protein